MKKGMWIGTVAALIVGLVLGWAFAGGRGTAKSQPTPAHVITVSGGASVSSAPDEAIVRLGVRTDNADSEAALQENNRKAADVMKALEALGIEEKDIQTTQVSLDQRVHDRGTPKETTTYIAENEVAVTVHDLTQVGDVVSQTVAAGANVVGGIEFRLSDLSKARSDALAKAIDAAQAKAEALAEAAGTTLGPVVRIDENGGESRPAFDKSFANLESFSGTSRDAFAAPIQPQDVQTEVNVTVVWALG